MRIAIDSSSQEDRVAALTLAELIMEGNKQGFEKRVLAFIQLSQSLRHIVQYLLKSSLKNAVKKRMRDWYKGRPDDAHTCQWYAMSQHVLM